MIIKPFYRWFDLWIGAFVDVPKRRVYFCFLGLGIMVQCDPRVEPTDDDGHVV